MNCPLHHYRELLGLTQLYLHREFEKKSVVGSNPATSHYFRQKLGLKAAHIQQTTPQKPVIPQAVKPFVAQVTPLPVPPQEKPQPTPATKTQVETLKQFIKPTHTVSLEPVASKSSQDFSEFWKLHSELFPHLPLIQNIPKDGAALKIKNSWQEESTIPPVIILSFKENEKEIAFLKNVAQAISLRLAKARVISASKWEKENGWDKLLNAPDLKLLIATDYDLYLRPELMKVYRENSQEGKHALNNIPLLLLSDLSLYLKEPQLKSLLWRAICNEFAASKLIP